ncbi:MAG TPA: iron-containing alcohol dehydrogenase [Actinomycetota bacterium]|nr:iron-containing alcohol dehydrogenase [Actinomycetota bacterium]
MDLPEILVFDSEDDEEAASTELARQLEGMGIEDPYVLSSRHGEGLARNLPGKSERPPVSADQKWAAEAGHRAQRAGAAAIVTIGGGRCLDVGKLAAARAGLTIVSVPTQLSHDGICSPVAVVPNEDNVAESLGAIAPRLVFLSMPTLSRAPNASVQAGIGDLLANPLALRDWALATERGLEDSDQRAWDLSVESFELIEPYLDTDPVESMKDQKFLRRLADALVLSGMAMIHSGTSRPASGGEHEISHAIDELYGGRALHGAQVAFGCIFSVALYGEDGDAFRSRLTRLGLPQHPQEMGLTMDDVVRVLLAAPNTRPGRFTILEASDLNESSARALVRRLWKD